MTFGRRLAGILHMLHRGFSGWRWRLGPRGEIEIAFPDRSLALCGDDGFGILRHGEEAERFALRWSAEAGVEADPDDLEIEDPGAAGPG